MSSNDYTTPDPFKDGPNDAPLDPRSTPLDPRLVPDQSDAGTTDELSVVEPEPIVPPTSVNTGTGFADENEGEGDSKAQEAASKAKDLAHEGQQSVSKVADSAKQEASMVAEQAKDKASNLLGELGNDVREQASAQQSRVASNLRDISDEFRNMLDQSQASGTASNLVDQAAHHSGKIADWLEGREPGDLVDEIKGFARRRPGAFLGLALGAGLLAGRITRNAGGASSSGRSNRSEPQLRNRTETESLTGESRMGVPQGMEPGTVPEPMEGDLLPPIQGGGTIGSGGVGGSGMNPGVAQPGTTYPRQSDFD